MGWSVVKCVAKIVAIAPVVNGSFWRSRKQSIAFGQRRLKLNDANEWWGGFAARPIFAAEFRRRTSLFPFSTNKRQTPTPPFERCTRRPAYD